MGKTIAILVVLSAIFVAYFLNKNLLHIGESDAELPPIPKDLYFGRGAPKADNTAIKPFKIAVPDEILADVRTRLQNARTFPPLDDARFNYGMNTDYLNHLKKHWLEKYSWRRHEGYLNQFPHFKTEIAGLNIHFIRDSPPTGKYKRVVPLLLSHGWPGSVYEFHKLIPLLTDPAQHLKKSAENVVAFEVIAPSIPGYGWSDAASKKGLSPSAVAHIYARLMSRLGFDKFYCQGGDWGAIITTNLATVYPERVMGLHVNMPLVNQRSPLAVLRLLVESWFPSLVVPTDISKIQSLLDIGLLLQETGYFHIQATKPDTVGFALNDSPLGLASYIIEKFSTWTNSDYRNLLDGGLTRHFTMDELLTNVMIYWTTQSIGTSQRLYKEYFQSGDITTYASLPVKVPTGIAIFPHELLRPPQRYAAMKYLNITQYTDMPRGGHFAAFEEPKLLANDILAFVAKLEA